MSGSGMNQEELNFFRLFKLTLSLGSEVLAKHIEKYCDHKGYSFEGLLNNKKHALSHLKKSSRSKCCCGVNRNNTTIFMDQWKQLYNDSGIRHSSDTPDVDCYESSVAKSTVQASDLDVSLVSCIILGAHDILQWVFKQCYPSFEELLRSNFHSLYHNRTRMGRLQCCKCTAEGPNIFLIDDREWNEMFERNGSTKCPRYRRNVIECSCQYSIKRNLKPEGVSLTLLSKIESRIGELSRLRDIRNSFCHVGCKDIGLRNEAFNSKCEVIKRTLEHLAEGISPEYLTELQGAIDTILNGPVDDAERQKLLEQFDKLREEQQAIVETQKRIEENQGKDEKRAYIESTKTEIEQHIKIFGVRTVAFQEGRRIFNDTRTVIFIGNIGQGKTWNALELLFECQNEGFLNIVKMDAHLKRSSWNSLVFGSTESNPSIVFIDNILYEYLEKELLETIVSAVNCRSVRIVATMTINEHAILEKSGYLPPLFIKRHMVHLSETENEKKELLSMKIDQKDPKNISIVDTKEEESFENVSDMKISEETISEIADVPYTDIGFPRCCAMFLSDNNNIQMGRSFFQQPFRITINIMKKLGKSADITKKLSFFILSNTLICKTFVTASKFRNELQSEIFQELADHFHLEGQHSPLNLESALEQLPEDYITKGTTRDGHVCYKLKHDSIKRAVFIAFAELGQTLEEFLILHCPIEMLENVSHDEKNTWKHELNNTDHLLRRFFDVICREYPDQHSVHKIIKHPIMSNRGFVQNLQEMLINKCCPMARRKMMTYGVKYDNKVVLDVFGESRNEADGFLETHLESDDSYRILLECCTYHSLHPNKDLIRQVEIRFETLAQKLPKSDLQQLLQISIRYFNKVTIKALLNLGIEPNQIGLEWLTGVTPVQYNACLLEESLSNNKCISEVRSLMDAFYSIRDTIKLLVLGEERPTFHFMSNHLWILDSLIGEYTRDPIISEEGKYCAFTLQEKYLHLGIIRPDIENYVNSEPSRITLCIFNRTCEFHNQVLKSYGCCSECTLTQEDFNMNSENAMKILGNVDIESTIFYEEHSEDDIPISSYTVLTFCEYHYAEFDFDMHKTEIGCAAEQIFTRRRKLLPHLPKGREIRDAFCKACEKGHFELASFILQAFDSLGTEEEQRESFEEGLQYAVNKGHARIVDAVMSWKSEFLYSSLLHTVFDRACELEHPQIVRYLMTRYFANAANRTQSHSDDITLDLGSITKQFSMACEKCDLKTAEVLLVYSVQEDLTKKMNDKDIKEVYDKAIKSGNNEVVNLMSRVTPWICGKIRCVIS